MRNRIVDDVIIHPVPKPIEKKEDVNQEIMKKFSDIGFTDIRSNFETSRD